MGWHPDGSLGFLGGAAGTSVSGRFVNQTSQPLTALEISLDVEPWRTPVAGAADGIIAALVTETGAIPLAGLSYTAGGAVTHFETVVAGLAILPGEEFQLRLSYVPGAGGGVAPEDVFVNEFHYDNAGFDTGEFVEIAWGPASAGLCRTWRSSLTMALTESPTATTR